MSLPAKRAPGGGSTPRRQRGGLPRKRGGVQPEEQQARGRRLSEYPPNGEVLADGARSSVPGLESTQSQADWSALSLHGLQEVTLRSLGVSDVRRLALALLTQWRRDVEIWTAALCDLRGVSRSERTEAADAAVAAEVEATEAEQATRVAEEAGAQPELVQRLREDAAQKRQLASQAHRLAVETARLAPLHPRCKTMYIEDFGGEKISAERALTLLEEGIIRSDTLVYSDDEGFPFAGWAPWSKCSHCFVAAPSDERSSSTVAVVSTSFYYSLDGVQPSDELPVAEMSDLVSRGVVSANTLIFSSDPCFGSEEWVPWRECSSRFTLEPASDAHETGKRDSPDSKRWRAKLHAERERGDTAAQKLAEIERLATIAAAAAAAQTLSSQEKLSQVEEELLDAQSALSMAEATDGMPEQLLIQLRQDVAAKEAVAIVVRSLAAGQAEALQEAEATAEFAASTAGAVAYTNHDGSPRTPRSPHDLNRSTDGYIAGEVLQERIDDLTDAVRLAMSVPSTEDSSRKVLFIRRHKIDHSYFKYK
jgi:hypothetical protein